MNEKEEQLQLPFGLNPEEVRELLLNEMRRQGIEQYIDHDGQIKDL